MMKKPTTQLNRMILNGKGREGAFHSLQSSCQKKGWSRDGFTLLEMLIVCVIIGILSSALTVSVKSAYKQARQSHCKSNLRQFGVAATIYRGEHDNEMPDWISNLYPEYVDDRSLYICRADTMHGTDRPRPRQLIDAGFSGYDNDTDRPPFWDNKKNSDASRNKTIEACSYLYEFSAARTTWWTDSPAAPTKPNPLTMKIYKNAQMRFGDSSNKDANGNIIPYSASHIPIIRCYHHWKDMKIYGYNNSSAKNSGNATRQFITINVAYAGNVFVGPTWWEGTIRPGEAKK